MTDFRSFFASSAIANEPRELLWENTLHQVARLLQEAERRVRSPEGKTKYTNLDGWWRKKKVRLKGKATVRVPSEVALTEAIITEIEILREEILLNQVPANDLLNIDTLQFSLEVPRRQKSGIGVRAKPTDIRVYRIGSEIIDLRIEAKVLVRDVEIKKSYLSNDGLKRFSDPKEPYTDHEIGGMLAYTICDDRSIWLLKIDEALNASKPTIPTFKHRVAAAAADEMLFCRVPYLSKQRTRRAEVLVFHMVLEFDSEPEGRSRA